jgi:hypothetical protein
MKAEELFTSIACIIIWTAAFIVLATTPIVVQDSYGNCIKVVPSSAGSCEALPTRYEVSINSK